MSTYVDTMSEKNAEIVAGLVTREGVNGRRTHSFAGKRALGELCGGVALHGRTKSETRSNSLQFISVPILAVRTSATTRSAFYLMRRSKRKSLVGRYLG